MGLIRFYLAISVVISHNGIRFPGIEGHLAVMAFFVISGFYMALVLNEKYQNNIWGFYSARFLRLWPSYIVLFCLVLLLVNPMDPEIYKSTFTAVYVWFSALSMFFYQTLGWFGFDSSGALVFLSTNEMNDTIPPLINATHMQQMWSIGVEICFYIVAPLFARKPKVIITLLVMSTAAFIAIKKFLFFHHPFDHRSAMSFFWLFLSGMLAYFGWRDFRTSEYAKSLNVLPWSIGGLTVAILCIIIGWQYFNNPYVTILCYAFFTLCIIPVFHASRKSKLDRFIGELSYPIYLTHWPIVAFVITSHRGSWLWSFILIGISILCSVALHFCVDRYVERIRVRLAKPKTSATTYVDDIPARDK